MPISTITTNDTIGIHVTRTSQLITAYNALESAGAINASITAQTAFGVANSAFANGNANFIIIQTVSGVANDAYIQANTARDTANLAFANANTTHTLTVAAFTQANTARDAANTATAAAAPGFNAANAAFNQANTATTIGSEAFGQANTATTIGSEAFGQANTARTHANSAYAKANTSGSNTVSGILQLANTFNYRKKTAAADANLAVGLRDAWVAMNTVAIPSGPTITLDFGAGFNFNVVLQSSTTIVPSNVSVGQSGFLRIKQNTSGGSVVSYDTSFKFASNVTPSNSTSANTEDVLFFHVIDTSRVFASLQKAVP